MASTTLGGKAEVAINAIVIPAQYLSEISVELTEGTRERDTLGGKFVKPSGVLETATAKFTLYLPSIDYLKNIFPSRYSAPNGNDTGNIILNSETCGTSEADAGPVNIHFTCDSNDHNDVHIYNGLAHFNFAATYTSGDDLTVEVTIYAQPDDDGNVARLGTGDLTQETIYDEVSETSVAVVS